MGPSTEKQQSRTAFWSVLLLVFLAHLLFMILSGKWPWSGNPYNSYVLQACSWLGGRLDVDNRPWLELAVYGGKYYVSFPPFPSYLLLPLAALFGESAPDGLLAFAVLLVGAAYAFRLALLCGAEEKTAAFLALFLYLGTNLWQVTVDAWVWFLAQSLAHTLTLMAFTHGVLGHKGRACFFLCAAVGCRPFQILYFPVVLYLLLRADAQPQGKWKRLLLEKDIRLLPAVLLALSFLALNFARFGNPFEFGHSWLPEFTRSDLGQFSPAYLRENLPSLLRLPHYDPAQRRLVFPEYNGCNIFLVFPLLLPYLYCLGRRILGGIQGGRGKAILPPLGLLALLLLHILLLCAHRTMGGAHFGNRYIADLMPAVFLSLSQAAGERKPAAAFLFWLPLALFGLVLNFTGVLLFYAGTVLKRKGHPRRRQLPIKH